MKTWLPQRLSARLLLSSALQLLLVGLALGLLGYATGRREGLERLAQERQRNQLTALSAALSMRLAAPQIINRDNSLAIRQGALNLEDFEQLGQRFWRQMQVYPVGYINWGSADGSFLGVERLEDGQLVLNEDSAKPLGRGRLGVYGLGPRGQRGRLLEVVPGMDNFHNEAWYAETVKANRATWSSIYQWEDKPEVFAISYNEPVRNGRGTLRGVIGVDFVLSQLSTWLQQLWRDQAGLALIVEPDGRLVASSRPELTLVKRGPARVRARLDQLADPVAQAATRAFFVSPPGGLRLRPNQAAIAAGPNQRLHQVTIQGHPHNVDASAWGRNQGLNWLLITAVNSDQALLGSQRQTAGAALLGLLALGGAVLLNRQLLQWLLAPMDLLRRRAQQALNRPTEPFAATLPEGSASELDAMASAFGELVLRLEQSQRELAEAAAREQRKDAEALQLLKHKLRSSLEASAVAHEIKLPLSQILLSSRLLLEADGSRPQLDSTTRESLQAIVTASERVVTTIENMRTLLRNVQTSHQPLNLAHLCRSALLYLKPIVSSAQVTVRTNGLETPCPIAGDASQLQIAIVNVLRNSFEALRQISGPRQIQISLSCQHQQAWLCIEDNGPGLPSGLNLLEPLEGTRSEGSGLGLFVVQTTLELHRGSIALGASATLGGAAVTLAFPRLEDSEDLPTSR